MCFAQQPVFAPEGATWWYTPWFLGLPDTSYYTFTAAGDSVLDGWNARIMRCSITYGGVLYPESDLDRYVVSAGDKVYYRVAGEFVLLFDFGAEVGDTIYSKVEQFPIPTSFFDPEPGEIWNFQYRIDSVSTMTLNGVNLRVQHLNNLYLDGMAPQWGVGSPYVMVVERIGSLGAYWWGNGLGAFLAGQPGRLRCYEDSEVFYHSPAVINQPCDYIYNTAAKEPALLKLSFYPNPATSTVRLPFIPDLLWCFDALGRQTALLLSDNTFEVSAFPAGLYYVLAEKGGRFYGGTLSVVK